MGVNKPYSLFAKKSDYTNGNKRHYKGLCDKEIDFMFDYNPFLYDVIGGSMSAIANHYYQQGVLSEPTIKAFKKAFGEPNLITDEKWVNHGEKGFCIKGIMVRTESEMRYLTYPEIAGLRKIPKNETCYTSSVYAFQWEDSLESIKVNYVQNYIDMYKDSKLENDQIYFILEELNDLNQMKNYGDLDARMSYIVRPRFFTNENEKGSTMMGPDHLRFDI